MKNPTPNHKGLQARARAFWQARQQRHALSGYSGYLLDESPPSLGRHRFEGEWADLAAYLQARGGPRHRCLDYGCGSGLWLQALAGVFEHADGWDYAPAMAAAARQRLAAAGVRNAKARSGSIQQIKGRQLYDLIFVGGVLMYTPQADLQPLLRGLRRLLKPGGSLVLRESAVEGATWVRQGQPLRAGLLASASPAASADYVAVYRSPQELCRQLAKAGLIARRLRPNRHYKLSDLTEDWLRRLDALCLGGLKGRPRLASMAAEGLYLARWIFLYPEYYFRKWQLQNYWFFCERSSSN